MLFLTDLTYGKPSSRVVPACLQVFINCIWQLNVKRYSVEIAVLKQVVKGTEAIVMSRSFGLNHDRHPESFNEENLTM